MQGTLRPLTRGSYTSLKILNRIINDRFVVKNCCSIGINTVLIFDDDFTKQQPDRNFDASQVRKKKTKSVGNCKRYSMSIKRYDFFFSLLCITWLQSIFVYQLANAWYSLNNTHFIYFCLFSSDVQFLFFVYLLFQSLIRLASFKVPAELCFYFFPFSLSLSPHPSHNRFSLWFFEWKNRNGDWGKKILKLTPKKKLCRVKKKTPRE